MPSKSEINRSKTQLLEMVLAGLPARYKIVYILHEVEEMRMSEISGCLGISESCAKVRLRRARLLLQERLFELSATPGIFGFGTRRCNSLVGKVMKALP